MNAKQKRRLARIERRRARFRDAEPDAVMEGFVEARDPDPDPEETPRQPPPGFEVVMSKPPVSGQLPEELPEASTAAAAVASRYPVIHRLGRCVERDTGMRLDSTQVKALAQEIRDVIEGLEAQMGLVNCCMDAMGAAIQGGLKVGQELLDSTY